MSVVGGVTSRASVARNYLTVLRMFSGTALSRAGALLALRVQSRWGDRFNDLVDAAGKGPSGRRIRPSGSPSTRFAARTTVRTCVKLADKCRDVIWKGQFQSRPEGSVKNRLNAPEYLSDSIRIKTKIDAITYGIDESGFTLTQSFASQYK